MILITTDASGAKKFFAGFYRDNTICWTVNEHVALDKSLAELRAIAQVCSVEQYNIRERLPVIQTFTMP